MAYDEALADRIRGVLLAERNVDEKKMFGGVTFMVDGQMCCGVLKDELIVKTGPEGFEDLVGRPNVRPFDFTGRPMVGIVYVAGPGVGRRCGAARVGATWSRLRAPPPEDQLAQGPPQVAI